MGKDRYDHLLMMGEKFTYSEYFFVCYEQEGYHADEGYLLFEG